MSPQDEREVEVRRLARIAFAMEVTQIDRDAPLSGLTDDEVDSIIDGILAAGRVPAALRQPGAEYRRGVEESYEAIMTYVRECNRDGQPALFSVAAPRILALLPDTKGERRG